MATITIDTDQLADLIAVRVVASLRELDLPHRDGNHRRDNGADGYLAPAAAARYLGIPRKRIYSLRSMGALVPAGHDGRTPLFTRATLDSYVRGDNRQTAAAGAVQRAPVGQDGSVHTDTGRNVRTASRVDSANPWTARHRNRSRPAC